MGLLFSMGQGLLTKLDFAKNEILEKYSHFWAKKSLLNFADRFTFSNACAIQTNLGANELLKKSCAREYGLLANESKIE